MTRPSLLFVVAALAFSFACPVGAQAGTGPSLSGAHLVAVYRGQLIPLREVADHHCHDRAALTIRCFDTEQMRNEDAGDEIANLDVEAGSLDLSANATLGLLSVTYVLWYEHPNYGGSSFSASGPIANLGSLGWNNKISSLKSTNGGRPRWWDYTYYTGMSWQWGVSAWVPYVGDGANERFTSVQNVP